MGAFEIKEPKVRELALRKQIVEFYLPMQLVDAIVEAGGIHSKSNEVLVGIGFLDISRYTFLSQFLSPPENQMVLNGLYSAFNCVLRRHGGYLNKIEGDSLMFHYGGPIDPKVKDLDEDDAVRTIAMELFYTCVEFQRVCSLFNQGNTNYLNRVSDKATIDAVLEAYRILSELRSGYASASFNALFQIRIRVGAALGRVLMGNFGPDGAKQWDVVGMPVIEAKRMESSAPIGGLRITSDFFDILHSAGITREYHERMRREAEAMGSVYRNIKFEELFKKAQVRLKDEKNAVFETYSIQVNPSLPESIFEQSQLLLSRGETGADAIVDFIEYYRGNHFVVNKLERLFESRDIRLRKDELFRTLRPKGYDEKLKAMGGDSRTLSDAIHSGESLYSLLCMLGTLQDSVKNSPDAPPLSGEFQDYDEWIDSVRSRLMGTYDAGKGVTRKSHYFYDVVFPVFFAHIKGAILEFQECADELEEA